MGRAGALTSLPWRATRYASEWSDPVSFWTRCSPRGVTGLLSQGAEPSLSLLLLAIAAVHAHGDGFELRAVSVSPLDPDEIWGVVENQGLVWTQDGGASWRWLCDSALGATRVYDVLALGEGRAAAALLGGVALVDTDCGVSALSGVPENAYADTLVADGEGLLAAISGADGGGIYRCTEEGCAALPLYGPDLFVKSILAVDGGFWATTTRSSDLAAALYVSEDGQTWEERYAWPEGDVDPRVLRAEGDTLLVWAVPRAAADVAQLLRSTDGGASFSAVYATESYTTAEGTLLVFDGGLLFGHDQGLVLWSEDEGLTWEEQSADLPTMVCGAQRGEGALLCADHLYDGLDLAASVDGWTWTPIACLEEASLPACAAESCAAALDNYGVQAGIGGGRCDEIINPPPVDAKAEGCGCRGEADSATLLFAIALLPLNRRGRPKPVP